MPEPHSLLGALQYADSFFPSGSIAFSWGLETLRADGEIVSKEQIAQFLEGQLLHRWASFDAPVLVAAMRAGGKVDCLADLDNLVEAMTLATELREGSRRAGASLLTVHAGLGTPGAAEYRRAIAVRKARAGICLWCRACCGTRPDFPNKCAARYPRTHCVPASSVPRCDWE